MDKFKNSKIPQQADSTKQPLSVSGAALCPVCKEWHPTCIICEAKQKQAIEMQKILEKEAKK